MSEANADQLSDVADIIMGSSPGGENVTADPSVGVPFISGNSDLGDVTPSTTRYCTAPKKYASRGDTILTVRAPVGDVNYSDATYCLGRGVAAVRFTEASARFGWHFLREQATELNQFAQGTTFLAVKRRDVEQLTVDFPHRSEQRYIADILDTVDRAIRKTEEVIDTLQCVMSGFLDDLLKFGLSRDGSVRDADSNPDLFINSESEFETIPRGWEVKELCEVASLSRGKFSHRPRNDPDFYDGPYSICPDR